MRIGVDLGGTKIEIIALDDSGATLLRRRVKTPAGDYAGTVRTIAELVSGAQSQLSASATVGIATPGALSPQSGLLRNSNSVVLNGKPLDQDIATALGQPVRLENDANCSPSLRQLMAQALVAPWYLAPFWEPASVAGSSSKGTS